MKVDSSSEISVIRQTRSRRKAPWKEKISATDVRLRITIASCRKHDPQKIEQEGANKHGSSKVEGNLRGVVCGDVGRKLGERVDVERLRI